MCHSPSGRAGVWGCWLSPLPTAYPGCWSARSWGPGRPRVAGHHCPRSHTLSLGPVLRVIPARAGGGSVPPGLPIPSRPPGRRGPELCLPRGAQPWRTHVQPCCCPGSVPASRAWRGSASAGRPVLHHRASPEGHLLSEACATVISVPTPPLPPVVDRRTAPRAALVPDSQNRVTSCGKGTWWV